MGFEFGICRLALLVALVAQNSGVGSLVMGLIKVCAPKHTYSILPALMTKINTCLEVIMWVPGSDFGALGSGLGSYWF